jgi:hypothetical protein
MNPENYEDIGELCVELERQNEQLANEVARLRELLGRMFSAGVGRMKVEDWRKLHAEYEQLNQLIK